MTPEQFHEIREIHRSLLTNQAITLLAISKLTDPEVSTALQAQAESTMAAAHALNAVIEAEGV